MSLPDPLRWPEAVGLLLSEAEVRDFHAVVVGLAESNRLMALALSTVGRATPEALCAPGVVELMDQANAASGGAADIMERLAARLRGQR